MENKNTFTPEKKQETIESIINFITEQFKENIEGFKTINATGLLMRSVLYDTIKIVNERFTDKNTGLIVREEVSLTKELVNRKQEDGKVSNLQILKNQQLIPVSENETGEVIVSGRDLHEFLKVQQDFSDWIKKQLEMIGAQENKDYCTHPFKRVRQILIEYDVTLDLAKEICMIAGVAPRTNEETKKLSKQARQYFISVEKAWNSPEMIMKRALEFANKRVQNLKLENEEQKKQLEEQKPKVIFADALEVSETSILIGDLAKLLRQNGINIGQNRLFEKLRSGGYLIKKKGDSYNMPTQYSMDIGLFEIKVRTINNPDGSVRTTKTTKVTGRGQIYFINKFIQEKAEEQLACSR